MSKIPQQKIELYSNFLLHLWVKGLPDFNKLFFDLYIDLPTFKNAEKLINAIENQTIAKQKMEKIQALFNEFILTTRM